jgi:hypothetical protein
VAAVPDKRQNSKQRRAARNRAYRDAMTARRENAGAVQSSSTARSSSASSGSSRSTSAAGGGRGRARSGGLAGGLLGRSERGPGDTAIMLTVAFAIAAAGLSIFAAFDDGAVPVDHEGEALDTFAGVSRATYSVLSGEAPVTETTSYIDAAGPVILLFIMLPVLVAIGTFVSHRRRVQSRPLTFGLVGMALVSVVNPFSLYFLPSLIALAVAGFQVRKAEMPERLGAAAADDDEDDDDDVIDVDEVEPEDELEDDDELDDEEYDEVEDDVVDVDEVESDEDADDADADVVPEDDDRVRAEDADTAVDDDETAADDTAGEPADTPGEERREGDDVLAELEAEIEAEEQPEGEGRRRRR